MKTILAASAFIFSAIAFAGSAQAETQSFSNPKVGAQRLDLCLNWGAGCGKPAADAWCASKGFDDSIGHNVANDIGAVSPTRLITTGAVCDQGYCDGFSQVTCHRASAPVPAMQIYVKPRHNGMRLDLCVNWGVGCGQPAANAYCQAKGWDHAATYSVANDIGATRPTRLIGTGAVCDQGYCDGFRQITCTN
ncbi:MAG: hypothetical protein WCC66_12320 [Rhizobiaceae bacterium]